MSSIDSIPATAATSADYFHNYAHLSMERDETGVLVVTMNDGDGGPITFSALDFSTFLNDPDPDANMRVYDEGAQIIENLLNIHVLVIAAVEGQALIHTEHALTANIVVAGDSATFGDMPHFAWGIVPGDGVYTAWAHRAGHGRAEAWLLNPTPISAATACAWGVVGEVVEDGTTLERARELAELYLQKPEVTRRNTRVHFTQPLKEEVVARVGFGLRLEAASIDALVQAMSN